MLTLLGMAKLPFWVLIVPHIVISLCMQQTVLVASILLLHLGIYIPNLSFIGASPFKP